MSKMRVRQILKFLFATQALQAAGVIRSSLTTSDGVAVDSPISVRSETDADPTAALQARTRTQKEGTMLQVNVHAAHEFVDTMANTGFPMEILGSCMHSEASTVEDGNGKLYKWSDFIRSHPHQETAVYPLKFRIDTAHQLSGLPSYSQPAMEQSEAIVKNFHEKFKETSSDPVFLEQVARQKEEARQQLKATNMNMSVTNLTGNMTDDAATAMVIDEINKSFAETCNEPDSAQTQDCLEYGVCLRMSQTVFGATMDPDFQHPTESETQQLVEACHAEEALVREDINTATNITDDERATWSNTAAEILPKCDHVGKTMKGYLASLSNGTLRSHGAFCTFMVNWVIPVDKEPPCYQFMELVKAEWMAITGTVKQWPWITQTASFGTAYQTACQLDGIDECTDKLTEVKNVSAAFIADLSSGTLDPNATDTDSQLQLQEKEELYNDQLCSVLGYDVIHPDYTEHDLIQLNQRKTLRAFNAGRFMRKKTKILFGLIAFGMLLDVGYGRKAYYYNVNVAGGFAAADVGIAFGYTSSHWVWFLRFPHVKTGMFASACRMLSTSFDAETGCGVVRFNNWGNIAGYSMTLAFGGAYKGVGGSMGPVFCCAYPWGGCHFCGWTVSPALDAEGNDISFQWLLCYTHELWSLGPIPLPTPDGIRNPVCFPGQSTVQTPSGVKSMQDLRVGDRVLTVGADDSLTFEEVYFFGHADPSVKATYLGLRVGADVLYLSSDHFVPTCPSSVNSCGWHQRLEVYAREVKVGDIVWVKNFESFKASKVTEIFSSQLPGVFNPYTTSGNIVVDGVVASCHSSWILDGFFPQRLRHWIPTVYQAIFLPGRMAYGVFGVAAADILDMNNPQVSPDTFGYGPMFALIAHGIIPLTLTMLFLYKRTK